MAAPSSASGRILRNIASGQLILQVSSAILDEYFDLASKDSVVELFGRHGVRASELSDVLRAILAESKLVNPEGDPPPCRDEDDRKFLHCASASQAHWLVTRDKDLLVETIGDTAILKPHEFLARLEGLDIQLEP